MPILLVLWLAVVAFVAFIPVAVVLRYRAGTARRRARGWMAALNLAGFSLSVGLFLAAAALTSRWVPGAFTYAMAGFGGGAVLGLLGLAMSRWEAAPPVLYYTPNRWLVLAITVVVSARVLYGFWRAWEAWQAAPEGQWVAASGAAGSLAAGAVVLGYYLIYSAGVWTRVRAVRARALQ